MKWRFHNFPWLPVLMPVVAGVWFWLRPLALPPDMVQVSLAAMHVCGAIIGYIFIRRLDNSVLHLGWTLLSLQILLDFCDEFTRNEHWDTWAQAAFAVSGYLVLATGLVRSQTALRNEAQRFRERERQLRHEANHDQLTGLANRSFFQDELAIRWHQVRPEDRASIAVLFLDLDGFKRVNDELGHLAGDELLRIVARRLKAALRDEDLVARVGGDELAALVGGVTDNAGLEALVERTHDRLTRPVSVGGATIAPRASIGVARGGQGIERPKDLLRAADAAMYEVKRAKLSAAAAQGLAEPSK